MIQILQSVPGAVSDAQPEQRWTFQASKGQRLSVRMQATFSAADSTEWSESAQGLAAEQEAVRTLQSYLKDARAATAQALQQLAERDATIDRLQTQLASVEALKTKSDATSRDVVGRVQEGIGQQPPDLAVGDSLSVQGKRLQDPVPVAVAQDHFQ